MDNDPATDPNGSPRPLRRSVALAPFLVLGANRILPDHSGVSLSRIIGDGFVPVVVATIAIASAVLFALD